MNYPYANGIINAIENQLFNQNQYSKLHKISENDFIKQLKEFGYGLNDDNVEASIASEMLKLRELINEISPNHKTTNLFFLEADAVNIKALLKRKVFNSQVNVLLDGGNILYEKLEQALFYEDFSDLPKDIVVLLKDIIKKIEEEISPYELSVLVDKKIYQYIFKSLPLLKDLALKEYFQLVVDVKNIIMFIRAKAINWNYQRLSMMFLKNGLISLTIFEEAYQKTTEDSIITLFKEYYNEVISDGLKRYFLNNDIDLLERYLEQMIINIMRKHRYDSFGIGTIIYYYLAKHAEANNIRLLYSDDVVTLDDLREY